MRHLTIAEPKAVIRGELAVPGDWVVANIDTHMSWPVKAQKVGAFTAAAKKFWES